MHWDTGDRGALVSTQNFFFIQVSCPVDSNHVIHLHPAVICPTMANPVKTAQSALKCTTWEEGRCKFSSAIHLQVNLSLGKWRRWFWGPELTLLQVNCCQRLWKFWIHKIYMYFFSSTKFKTWGQLQSNTICSHYTTLSLYWNKIISNFVGYSWHLRAVFSPLNSLQTFCSKTQEKSNRTSAKYLLQPALLKMRPLIEEWPYRARTLPCLIVGEAQYPRLMVPVSAAP